MSRSPATSSPTRREGAARYAAQLDREYGNGDIAFAFAVEPVLWLVGPSDPLRRAVTEATSDHVPTTWIITGPWSLWALAFGADAIDVGRFRQQALAAGDVVTALDHVPRDEIAGGYLADRRARAEAAPVGSEYEPPEVAPTCRRA